MLIDNNGDEIGAGNSLDDVADARGDHDSEPPAAPIQELLQSKPLFVAVSVACFTAAVAAASYAIYLDRRKAAQKALTSVHDLLKTCEMRMSQMDKELKRLPQARSSSGA